MLAGADDHIAAALLSSSSGKAVHEPSVRGPPTFMFCGWLVVGEEYCVGLAGDGTLEYGPEVGMKPELNIALSGAPPLDSVSDRCPDDVEDREPDADAKVPQSLDRDRLGIFESLSWKAGCSGKRPSSSLCIGRETSLVVNVGGGGLDITRPSWGTVKADCIDCCWSR